MGALLAVTRERERIVYFVTGHGERSPDDSDRKTGAVGRQANARRRSVHRSRPAADRHRGHAGRTPPCRDGGAAKGLPAGRARPHRSLDSPRRQSPRAGRPGSCRQRSPSWSARFGIGGSGSRHRRPRAAARGRGGRHGDGLRHAAVVSRQRHPGGAAGLLVRHVLSTSPRRTPASTVAFLKTSSASYPAAPGAPERRPDGASDGRAGRRRRAVPDRGAERARDRSRRQRFRKQRRPRLSRQQGSPPEQHQLARPRGVAAVGARSVQGGGTRTVLRDRGAGGVGRSGLATVLQPAFFFGVATLVILRRRRQ